MLSVLLSKIHKANICMREFVNGPCTGTKMTYKWKNIFSTYHVSLSRLLTSKRKQFKKNLSKNTQSGYLKTYYFALSPGDFGF